MVAEAEHRTRLALGRRDLQEFAQLGRALRIMLGINAARAGGAKRKPWQAHGRRPGPRGRQQRLPEFWAFNADITRLRDLTHHHEKSIE